MVQMAVIWNICLRQYLDVCIQAHLHHGQEHCQSKARTRDLNSYFQTCRTLWPPRLTVVASRGQTLQRYKYPHRIPSLSPFLPYALGEPATKERKLGLLGIFSIEGV